MKRLKINTVPILAASFFALAASSANATDLLDGLNDPAPQGTAVNWSGVYLGGRLGYGITTGDVDLQHEDGDVYETYQSFNGLSGDSVTGGFQLGYDQQIGRFVLGIVGSYDFSDAEFTFADGDDNVGASKGEEWSIGGRAGVLLSPRTMVYGLLAYTEADFDHDVSDLPGGFTAGSETVSGYTFGGGIEHAVSDNVFMGIEGTYTDFENFNILNENECLRIGVDPSELRVLGTLKIKLNSF
jgi:outer membrane immunogenic protein